MPTKLEQKKLSNLLWGSLIIIIIVGAICYTYLKRHYTTIHPRDISQQFPIFTQTPDYEEYSVDDWKWKEVNIGRPTFVKNRRKRIISKGSSNQSHPKYSSYFDVRSISEFAKNDRKWHFSY